MIVPITNHILKTTIFFTIVFLNINVNWAQLKVVKTTIEDEIHSGEAEDFVKQKKTSKRKWHKTTKVSTPKIYPDPDNNHSTNASKGIYLEVLPDTRSTTEKVIEGENFSKTPGKVGVLYYDVEFRSAGKYYLWTRGYSTGTEDNGIHAGIDGTWPESSQRIHFCTDRGKWTWASIQRNGKEACDNNNERIYIEIKEPGLHQLMFSMREDGFEFDKWLLTKRRSFTPEMFF